MTETVLSDKQIRAALDEHGTQSAAARSLGVAESTFKDAVKRRGLRTRTARPSKPSKGLLTREALHAALLPPNNCRVKQFLEALDDEQRDVVREALSYDKRDLPAPKLADLLVKSGFDQTVVPGADAINAHRAGTKPCRCRG